MPYEFLVVVGLVIEECDVHLGPVGHEYAAGPQPLVARVDDRVEHGLVEQEVAHPLGDDDVDLLHRQLDLLHQSVEDGDLV